MTHLELAAIHARCFTTPRPWSAEEFSDILGQKGVFKCTEGRHAFLLGRVAGPEAELLTLAVAPEFRRRGLGASLVSAFLATARAHNAEDAFLEVALTNQAAFGLYVQQGFIQSGLRKDYYANNGGPKVSAIVMTRHL